MLVRVVRSLPGYAQLRREYLCTSAICLQRHRRTIERKRRAHVERLKHIVITVEQRDEEITARKEAAESAQSQARLTFPTTPAPLVR